MPEEMEPCLPRARQEGHLRRFTVIHGATDSARELCSRRSCGRGHLLCKQGVRGSSLLSFTGVISTGSTRPLYGCA
jgi:hypothetical protein